MRKSILGLCLVILCLSIGLAFAGSNKPNLKAINSSIGLFSGDDVIEGEGITVFEVLRAIIFWFSPIIFFVGLLLVLYGNFRKMEAVLSREMGLRKKVFPRLEVYNYAFHEWLLEKNVLVGLICIACGIVFFFVLK